MRFMPGITKIQNTNTGSAVRPLCESWIPDTNKITDTVKRFTKMVNHAAVIIYHGKAPRLEVCTAYFEKSPNLVITEAGDKLSGMPFLRDMFDPKGAMWRYISYICEEFKFKPQEGFRFYDMEAGCVWNIIAPNAALLRQA